VETNYFLGWLSAAELTAAANGIWIAIGLASAASAHYLRHFHAVTLGPHLYTALFWVAMAGYAVAIHRLYWNIGIWTAPVGKAYHSDIVSYRGITLLLVLALAWAHYRGWSSMLQGRLRNCYSHCLLVWILLLVGISVGLA